ncbi:MAG: hydroxymethylglutaryl-CoA lyase [Pseudomonadota bacterium]
MSTDSVLISEVGPRDGLQNCRAVMPTDEKKRLIDALAAAGLTEIEVGSFVSPKLLPQMADTGEIVRHARRIPGLTVAVLVPNRKGAALALEAGAHKLTLPLSVSETHSIRNINRTHAQVLEEARSIAELIGQAPKERRPHFEGSLSTAFGCTIEGPIPEPIILGLAESLVAAGCDEVGISDTSGYADPASIKRLIRSVRRVIGDDKVTGIHLHNTRGLGLANAYSALEEGITAFDSSIAGLGGCPTAPGASGNVVTEDLVFMFESMGVKTGVDLDKLVAARDMLARSLPDEPLYGLYAGAGAPIGFAGAAIAGSAGQ